MDIKEMAKLLELEEKELKTKLMITALRKAIIESRKEEDKSSKDELPSNQDPLVAETIG